MTVRGVPLRALDTGPEGAAGALVFLHGFLGSADDFILPMRRLADRVRCVAPDLPGHGGSAAPPEPARYAMAEAAADLSALCAELHLRRVAAVGYSMGGRIALGWAAQHPPEVAGLLLESASPGLATEKERAERRAADERLAQRLEADGVGPFVAMWERLPLFASQAALPAAARERQRRTRLRQRAGGLAASLRGIGTGAQPSCWDDLPSLDVPTLLVTGALDARFTAVADAMAALLPRGSRRACAGAGHNVHLEAPDWYGECVDTFARAIL